MVGRFALFIFLDIADEPASGSPAAAGLARPARKHLQIRSPTLNREPFNIEPK
jgi:hypothetical protein